MIKSTQFLLSFFVSSETNKSLIKQWFGIELKDTNIISEQDGKMPKVRFKGINNMAKGTFDLKFGYYEYSDGTRRNVCNISDYPMNKVQPLLNGAFPIRDSMCANFKKNLIKKIVIPEGIKYFTCENCPVEEIEFPDTLIRVSLNNTPNIKEFTIPPLLERLECNNNLYIPNIDSYDGELKTRM